MQSVQKHTAITLERVEKFLSKIYWADVNVTGIEYSRRSEAAVTMTCCSPSEPRPTFQHVLKAYTFSVPAKVGVAFGLSWSTHWIKVEVAIPEDEAWRGQTVHFLFDANCEGLIHQDGRPTQVHGC